LKAYADTSFLVSLYLEDDHTDVANAWMKRRACPLGEAQAELTGVRAADLLHLGIASLLETEEFLTFDATQRKAAIGAGLTCKV
jgi:predicted nucleic acid-binding protein